MAPVTNNELAIPFYGGPVTGNALIVVVLAAAINFNAIIVTFRTNGASSAKMERQRQ